MSQQHRSKFLAVPDLLSQRNLFLGLPVLAWFLVGVRANVQNDTWWHLRTGKLILYTRSIPVIDPYSWVLGDNAPWPNHEWLSQLLFYSLFAASGPAALHLLIGSLFGIAAAFFFLAMRGRCEVRALILLALLPWLATASAIRPHAFTLTFTALTIYALLQRRFSWLPFILLAWVQFHGGVCFGGVLLMAALAAALCTQRSLLPVLLVAVGLAGASVAINPLGIGIYTHPFTSTAMARALPLIEWAPPSFESLLGILFWISAAGLCILAMVRWRSLQCWEVAMLVIASIAVFPLAARHVRNVYLWMPIAGVTATHLLCSSDLREAVRSMKYLIMLVCSAVTAAILAVLSISESATSASWHPVSTEALAVLEASSGPLFNTYDTGGYLIWFSPKTKVFIDSRQDPYPIKLLQQTIEVQLTGEFTQFFSGFGFTKAVVEPHMPLAHALVKSRWSVAARAPAFLVLVAPETSEDRRTDGVILDITIP